MTATPAPATLRTARLLLRPWHADDAPAVLAACSDPEVRRWTRVPDPYTGADARAFVEQWAPAQWATGRGAPFAVLDAGPEVDRGAAAGRLVASVSLMRIEEGAAEIGYWAAPHARGRGVATEAVDAVCRWGFDQLGLQRVEWLAYVGNEASRRVAERVGFRQEGLLRSALVQRGRRQDAWIAGLLPRDLSPRRRSSAGGDPVQARP